MKALPETTLLTVLTGSHLYGTATEKSDYDYKAICMPSMDELLLNTKITNRKEKPEGSGHQDKMLAGEIETEYLPIQVFLTDFFAGQTYALEVAFAVALGKYELNQKCFHYYDYQQLMLEMIRKFLTKDVKKMTGYAVSQSKLYGLKTERYTTIKTALEMIDTEFNDDNDVLRNTRLEDTPDFLEALCEVDHVKMSTAMNGSGGSEEVPALEICGKKHVVTSYWVTILKSLLKTMDTYGERVKAFGGQGTDWKAMSHAIRITEQVLELCKDGCLTFPHFNAKFLLDVKSGNVPLAEATEYLQHAFSKIDDVVNASKLQERTPLLESQFREWKLHVLKNMYGFDN